MSLKTGVSSNVKITITIRCILLETNIKKVSLHELQTAESGGRGGGQVAAGQVARKIIDDKFKVIYKFGTFRRNQIIQMSTTSKYAKFSVKFCSVQVD